MGENKLLNMEKALGQKIIALVGNEMDKWEIDGDAKIAVVLSTVTSVLITFIASAAISSEDSENLERLTIENIQEQLDDSRQGLWGNDDT